MNSFEEFYKEIIIQINDMEPKLTDSKYNLDTYPFKYFNNIVTPYKLFLNKEISDFLKIYFYEFVDNKSNEEKFVIFDLLAMCFYVTKQGEKAEKAHRIESQHITNKDYFEEYF